MTASERELREAWTALDWHVKGKHTKGQTQASQESCEHGGNPDMNKATQSAVHDKIEEISKKYYDPKVSGSEFALWLFNQLKTSCITEMNTCGHQLSESESNYYDNHPHLARLCKRCTMEERAR